MLLMVEKGVIGEICQPVHRYAKTNNKYMKNYDKSIKPSSYLAYLDANNFDGWVMSQNLMINGFKWVEKYQDLMRDSEKTTIKIVIEDIFLK